MDIIESILVLSKAGFSAGDIKAMLSLRSQTPAQPVQQMPTPAQPVQQMQTPAQPVQKMQTPAQPVQQMQTLAQPVQQMQTPAQPVQQMPTPAQPVQQTSGLDPQLIGNLMNSITGLQNAIQAQAIFYTQQPQMSGAQMADDALASIVLPSNNS